MTQAQHTQGPWLIRETVANIQIYSEDSFTAKNGHKLKSSTITAININSARGLDVVKANAHLISAAPDLLEALEKLVDLYDRGIVDHSAYIAAHHIITKAKGGAA